MNSLAYSQVATPRINCTFYNDICAPFDGFSLGKLQSAKRNCTNNVKESGICGANSRICAPGIENNTSFMNYFANYYYPVENFRPHPRRAVPSSFVVSGKAAP